MKNKMSFTSRDERRIVGSKPLSKFKEIEDILIFPQSVFVCFTRF
jgi:hypothetical protein